jgi:Na+/H+-dicarboxylate symporter
VLNWWFQIPLWVRILGGVALGAATGLALVQFGPQYGFDGKAIAESMKPIGDTFVQAIRMLVVPLIFTTLVAGVCALEDVKRLGSIGIKALVLFTVTTFFAVSLGIGLALVIQPGVGIDISTATPRDLVEAPDAMQRVLAIIPANIVKAFAETEVLAIILFSILFGIGILMAGEKGQPVAKLFEGASEAMLNVTKIIMEFAPFGVFALVAWVVGTQGPGLLLNLAKLAGLVYLGCVLHAVIVYGAILKFFARLPVLPFFRGMLDAMAVAYSTASSNATLPVNMKCVTENLGVKKSVAGAILPLGATVNMDGSAMYLGAAAIFAAQIFNVPLEFPTLLAIAGAVTLASIGAAGIPSAATVLLATVLAVMNFTAEQSALVIGFILAFDRLMDMARTTVNILGDAAVATTVAKWEGEIDEREYRQMKGDI